MNSTTPERGHRRATLTAILAGLIMIGPFSIDTMFPGFPAMQRDLGASALVVQQTISVYLLAYAMMSLAHGPVSDRFGRKPVILLGLLAYGAGAAGAAMATSMPDLLAWRAVQGMSAGAGIVVARAMIRDLFDGAQAQRLMAQVTMIFGIAPAIAPVVGAQLVLLGGWRFIFWGLAAFAGLLVLATQWRLPESLPVEQRVSLAPRSLARGYASILRDVPFWPLAISGTLNFAALFVYILSAPRVVLELMGLSEQGFPWLFVPIIGGMVTGAALSSRLAGRRSADTTVNLGYALMALGTLGNLLLALATGLPFPRWGLLPLALIGIGVGISSPTLTLLLLDRFPQRRGAASSMQAFFSLLFNALLAGVIAPLLYRDMRWLALGAAAATVLGWMAWCLFQRMQRKALRQRKAAAAMDVAGRIGPGQVL